MKQHFVSSDGDSRRFAAIRMLFNFLVPDSSGTATFADRTALSRQNVYVMKGDTRNLRHHIFSQTLWAGILFLPVAAHSSSGFLVGFPIAGRNPYTAPIITVLDHSAPFFYDPSWTQVVAYTGEIGKDHCGPSGQPCGYYNPNFSSSSNLTFIANGSYVGFSMDGVDRYKVLNYRGHSGYDYNYGQGINIVAPQDGTLYIPAFDPINSGQKDPWCRWHTFYLDHGNGWTTWYLHVDHLTVGTPHSCPNGVDSNIPSDEVPAEQPIQVHKGDVIAVVGNFGNGQLGGVGYHLHFEVRRGCDRSTGSVQGCMVVDPYGWEWPGGDPISNNKCSDGLSICATPQTIPLWSLADWNVQQPFISNVSLVPSSGGYTATISGRNFSPLADVTLWDRHGQYLWMTLPRSSITSITSTQIIAQLSNPPISSPSTLVLKVGNPQGPRSIGVPLTVSGGVTSVPLVINGGPAPGGGFFASFNGFWSFTNRGDGVFGAGLATTPDGPPTRFEDFRFSAGQITKPSVPGFGAISSVRTHLRINNRGDMAFGDLNGTYGAEPAGIYILPAGSSSPVQVVAWGQPCPSPCPVAGSPTIYQLEGPLAFDDQGDVTFAAALLDPQTSTASCCFLFLYSGLDGSVVKVAADGPNGDISPTGGMFASGTLSFPITQLTADSDVLFLAQVTGGRSQGGIFRYSRSRGLSSVVVEGDPAPGTIGGVLGYPLFGRTGSVSGRQVVFHTPIVGAASAQIIGSIQDVTAAGSVVLVAYQGQNTNTSVGGAFSDPSGRPFGGYGQNTAPPSVRADGAVVFPSLLVGARTAGGVPTGEGVFLWNPRGFQKIVVDGEPIASGPTLQGISAATINDVGQILYFAARVQ